MEQYELSNANEETGRKPHRDSPVEASLQENTSEPQSATFFNLYISVGSLYLGTFLVALDTTIINTALPAITTEFRALADLAWYGSAYLLALTALQPTFGKLYKVIDTKHLYLISIVVFEGTSISILCSVH
jgi:MFS family permease